MTEGQREPAGEHGHPAAADDKTTAIVVPPSIPDLNANAGGGTQTDARPRVMLLGSGELSRELAIALRHLGAKVIAVDDYAHAPAHWVADQSLVIPMADADELSKM